MISRRQFSHATLLALGAATAPVLGARPRTAGCGSHPFQHGVASGDPLHDRVILWTRITTDTAEALPVRWEIATDRDFARIVNAGEIGALPTRDHTVKVDALGLQPGSSYYYRFTACGAASPVGRTRTSPAGHVAHVRLAVTSCANYPFGYFNAYARIAARNDLDAVLCLGDYCYEYAPGTYGSGDAFGRVPIPPREIVSLTDYRQRHAQYKTDIDLQAAHQMHPWITVWDDHETADNSFRDGAHNHNPELGEGAWSDRKAAAIRAYYEWMPIREPSAGDDRTYRTFRFGDLVDLIMLDTRLHGRTMQLADRHDSTALADPTRTILGADQQQWLAAELRESKRRDTAWRVIGQQCMFGQMVDADGVLLNPDQWDGYPFSRQAVLEQLAAESINDSVIVSGDLHSSWALDIAPDPFSAAYDCATGHGALAVEMVTPAVSSPPAFMDQPDVLERERRTMQQPHIAWVEFRSRGYLLLDIDSRRARGEWWLLDNVDQRGAPQHMAAAWQTLRGHNHLVRG